MQVISGGELDINFFIKGPNGNILASDDHKLDSLNSVDVRESGEYEICLDNSFSRMSEKLVFVDIIIEDDVAREEEKKRMGVGADLAESMEVDMKLQNLSVRNSLFFFSLMSIDHVLSYCSMYLLISLYISIKLCVTSSSSGLESHVIVTHSKVAMVGSCGGLSPTVW